MNPRRVLAVTRRVMEGFRRDRRTLGLLFGVLTDYLVFFVSGYRQRLRSGAEPLADCLWCKAGHRCPKYIGQGDRGIETFTCQFFGNPCYTTCRAPSAR